jgi:hypothetical protein
LSAAADDRIAQFDVVGADERFGDEAVAAFSVSRQPSGRRWQLPRPVR